jgi:CBS-domain-containing membrane protein
MMVAEAVKRMVAHNIGALAVTEKGTTVVNGIFSERDYLNKVSLCLAFEDAFKHEFYFSPVVRDDFLGSCGNIRTNTADHSSISSRTTLLFVASGGVHEQGPDQDVHRLRGHHGLPQPGVGHSREPHRQVHGEDAGERRGT